MSDNQNTITSSDVKETTNSNHKKTKMPKYRNHHDFKPKFMQNWAYNKHLNKKFKIFFFMLVIINLIVSTPIFFTDKLLFIQYCTIFSLCLYIIRIPNFYYLDYHTFLHDCCYYSLLFQAYYCFSR